MKTPRIECNLCDRSVRDTFKSKWNHIVECHPDVIVQRMFAAIAQTGVTPERCFESGRETAAAILDFFTQR